MKSVEVIQKRIDEIATDEEYISGLKHPATISENAPLALIQLEMETQIKTLKWVIA